MFASMNDHPDIVELLITNNAEVNKTNNVGVSALMYAAAYGNVRCVNNILLEHKCDVTLRSNNGNTAADLAKQNNQPEIVKILTSAYSQRHVTSQGAKSITSRKQGSKKKQQK